MIIHEKELGDGRREMLPFNRDTALAETYLCTVIAFIFTQVARVVLSKHIHSYPYYYHSQQGVICI